MQTRVSLKALFELCIMQRDMFLCLLHYYHLFIEPHLNILFMFGKEKAWHFCDWIKHSNDHFLGWLFSSSPSLSGILKVWFCGYSCHLHFFILRYMEVIGYFKQWQMLLVYERHQLRLLRLLMVILSSARQMLDQCHEVILSYYNILLRQHGVHDVVSCPAVSGTRYL